MQETHKTKCRQFFFFCRSLPEPPSKLARYAAANDIHSSKNVEIPHLIQGEIARLDQKFKITLDPTSQFGTKIIKLLCFLDDKFLPCVPPISVVVPDDYPAHAPRCTLIEGDYTTPLFSAIHNALSARISKLPKKYSLSQLMDVWEMSVRQACSPNDLSPSQTEVLLGI